MTAFEPKNPGYRAAAIAMFDAQPATTLLAPARGERFVFKAEVVKPGRTLTFCEAKAYAEHDGKTKQIATMTGTLMAMLPAA
ncbi:PaaI family thioesterase [Bradyrhizobium sp. CNPSo 4010]|uniref:PaaI family thioesterase n=1 Tax=Bradyrhizobium agreste TaxID=2751811 RepID=A0ABS0PQC4_9BRAD|nr:PaaI family thioesterase [Bradyrhizobium agreste]MBH5399107.1 PaaI family thioesterase [Bradyrhizobium agreste]